MSTHEKTVYERFLRNPTLKERALAALRKEEADKAAAEEAYRRKQEQRARDELRFAIGRVIGRYEGEVTVSGLESLFGTDARWDMEYRQAYNAPTVWYGDTGFYLNLTDGIVRNHDSDIRRPQDYLWAAILCSQCEQTAASIQLTPAHAGHDPMADLGRLFTLAGDPPMCGTCRPACKGCEWGEENEHTCQVCDGCNERHDSHRGC